MKRTVMRYIALVISILFIANESQAQDYMMRRTNSVGHWIMNIENEGHFFNADDSLRPTFPGSYWRNPQGGIDTLIFGGGIWVGGYREIVGKRSPAVSFAYEPNGATDLFVPGSAVYDGASGDTSQLARDKYRVYRSTDKVGQPWPIRSTSNGPEYIDDPSIRQQAGAPFVYGDEDLFAIYKDTDSTANVSGHTHLAAGVEVRSQLSFWATGIGRDIVIVHNAIVRTASDSLYDPVIALALDGDINFPDNDRLKGLQTEGARCAVFFTNTSTTDPYLGVELLSGQYNAARFDQGMTTLKYWDITEDPLTDSDRFAFMTSGEFDTATSKVGDARLLMASASHEAIGFHDTLYFDYALFAVPASGKPALDPTDSARVLRLAQQILGSYNRHNLAQLSVGRLTQSPSLSIYPNPARDEVVIRGLPVQGNEVILLDALGRIIARSNARSGEVIFRLGSLPTATYFIRIPQTGEVVGFEHVR